ncbi:MAG: hypothetical protein WDA72_07765, partial [Desulfomonilia bacterium]
ILPLGRTALLGRTAVRPYLAYILPLGRTAVRPYRITRNDYNPVEMIWHDDPGVQFDFMAYCAGFYPFIRNDFPCVIQSHFALNDVPEQTLSILGAKGDEIGACLRIIIPLQPN